MLGFLKEAQSLIHQDIQLDEAKTSQDTDSLLRVIEQRVSELLAEDDRLLFSYLYRLDISEAHLKKVMRDHKADKILAISKLILDRQLLRLKTKKEYPQSPIEDGDW